jgi:hypothetical protein
VDLVRSWLGQALRATGAAVVVPVAILVALSLTAIGGSGLGDLGALSQIVSGPRVAGSGVRVDDGGSEIADAVTQIAATPATGSVPAGGAPPASDNGGDDGGPGGGTPPGGSPPPSNPPGGGAPPNDNGGNGGGGGGGGGTPPPGSPPPPEPPATGIVGGAGETVKDVTAGTPVAPTVEDAVDGLVDTCARLGCP